MINRRHVLGLWTSISSFQRWHIQRKAKSRPCLCTDSQSAALSWWVLPLPEPSINPARAGPPPRLPFDCLSLGRTASPLACFPKHGTDLRMKVEVLSGPHTTPRAPRHRGDLRAPFHTFGGTALRFAPGTATHWLVWHSVHRSAISATWHIGAPLLDFFTQVTLSFDYLWGIAIGILTRWPCSHWNVASHCTPGTSAWSLNLILKTFLPLCRNELETWILFLSSTFVTFHQKTPAGIVSFYLGTNI